MRRFSWSRLANILFAAMTLVLLTNWVYIFWLIVWGGYRLR